MQDLDISQELAVKNSIQRKQFYIESYGCAMNFSDSEIIGSILNAHGYGITQDEFDADAKGLMPVYDLQLAKSGVEEKKCWRMVNFETVFEVKTNGEVYKIV